MNYEQKYKEALDAARHIYEDMKSGGNFGGMEDLEVIFPELAESEDERIRTRLSEYFRGFLEGNEHCYKDGGYVKWEGLDVKSILDWLEKQKEQKPAEWGEKDKANTEFLIELLEEHKTGCKSDEYGSFLKEKYQGMIDWLSSRYAQPKVEWSEEDEHRKTDAIYFLESAKKHYADTSEIEATIVWLKSLCPKRVNVSDQTLQLLICYLYGCHDVAKKDWEKADCRRYISYLENLDYTLKNRWKPSEEQMEALKKVACNLVGTGTETDVYLVQLYEQLKAL